MTNEHSARFEAFAQELLETAHGQVPGTTNTRSASTQLPV